MLDLYAKLLEIERDHIMGPNTIQKGEPRQNSWRWTEQAEATKSRRHSVFGLNS